MQSLLHCLRVGAQFLALRRQPPGVVLARPFGHRLGHAKSIIESMITTMRFFLASRWRLLALVLLLAVLAVSLGWCDPPDGGGIPGPWRK